MNNKNIISGLAKNHSNLFHLEKQFSCVISDSLYKISTNIILYKEQYKFKFLKYWKSYSKWLGRMFAELNIFHKSTYTSSKPSSCYIFLSFCPSYIFWCYLYPCSCHRMILDPNEMIKYVKLHIFVMDLGQNFFWNSSMCEPFSDLLHK